jgi:hypothetical protein
LRRRPFAGRREEKCWPTWTPIPGKWFVSLACAVGAQRAHALPVSDAVGLVAPRHRCQMVHLWPLRHPCPSLISCSSLRTEADPCFIHDCDRRVNPSKSIFTLGGGSPFCAGRPAQDARGSKTPVRWVSPKRNLRTTPVVDAASRWFATINGRRPADGRRRNFDRPWRSLDAASVPVRGIHGAHDWSRVLTQDAFQYRPCARTPRHAQRSPAAHP